MFVRKAMFSVLYVLLMLSAGSVLAETVPDRPTNFKPASLSPDSACPVVTTQDQWKLTGGSPTGYDDLCGYWGIPYAASTAKENRWKAPQPLKKNQSFTAQSYGPWCPQLHNGAPVGNEDCLRLNIWAPKETPAGPLPVMVFIHGGAFIQGASDVPSPFGEGGTYHDNLYDGAYMSSKASEDGLVVVSINYRLGAMGFLASEAAKFDGNYGIHDQLAALQWVQANIDKFGGDKSKVTIWGESAGAMSVALHMLSISESYNGKLFRAGILESNLPGLPYKTTKEAETSYNLFTEAVKSSCDASCLRKADLYTLLEAQKAAVTTPPKGKFDQFLEWTPVMGGLVENQPMDGKFAQPAIMGTNRNEGILFGYEVVSGLKHGKIGWLVYDGIIKHFFGCPEDAQRCTSHAGDVENEYPTTISTPSFVKAQLISDIITDYIFTCANDQLAKNNFNGSGEKVYTYLFDQTADFYTLPQFPCSSSEDDALALLCQCWDTGNLSSVRPQASPAACHGAELPYVFNSPGFTFNEAQGKIAKKMASQWAQFATTLNPGWANYTTGSNTPYQVFSPNGEGDTAMGNVPNAAKCGFWQGTVKYPTAPSLMNVLPSLR